jgi:hypothetical protein
VVNKRLSKFICMAHHCVVPVESIVSHFSKNHSMGRRQLPGGDVLESVVMDLGVTYGYPPVPVEPELEFGGLTVITGYQCPVCGHGYKNLESLKSHGGGHYTKSGHNVSKAKSIYMQRFSETGGDPAIYFEVFVVGSRSNDPNIASFVKEARLKLEKSQLRVPAAKVDIRDISPWLQRTNWHIYTDGYDASILAHILDLPKKEDGLYLISRAVTEIFREANGLIEETSDLALCKLNTAEPEK